MACCVNGSIAPNIEALIVFRLLQGIAGGLLIPAAMTIVGEAAGAARIGRVMSTSAVPAILAPAIGPVLIAFTWRSLRRESPLLDLRLITNRVYAAAAV